MKKKVRIETRRLIIRDFLSGEWEFMHEYASDPRVVRHVPFGPNTPTQTKAYLKTVLASQRLKKRKDFPLAIFTKQDGRFIGGCRLNCAGSVQQDAGLGYVVIRRYWGDGYATEAAKAMIRFGFSKLKLHRIWATCDTRNKASARVMEKAGMEREGLLRKNVFQKGAWRDSYLYAILNRKRNSHR